MKKLISMLSAVLIICNMFPTFAADDTVKDFYENGEKYEQRGDFAYYPGTNQIFMYVGNSKDVLIPEGSDATRIKGSMEDKLKSVTISNNVPFDNFNLSAETVILADGIKDIPDAAFYNSAMKNIVMPDTLETIGDNAFAKSSLECDLELPDSLRSIGEEAFKESRIKSVKMGDNVTYIGDRAFSQCYSLKEARLSDNLVKLGDDILYGANLKKVNIPKSLDISAEDCGDFGVTKDWDKCEVELNRPMSVELLDYLGQFADWEKYCKSDKLKNYKDGDDWCVIGDVLVGYTGNDKKAEIPDFISEVHSFLTSDKQNSTKHDTVIIPSSVKKLDDSCFVMYSMESLVVPETVEEIGRNFVANTGIKELTIEGTPKINSEALGGAVFLLKDKLHINPECKLPSDFDMDDLATEEYWLKDPEYTANHTPKPTSAATAEPDTPQTTETPTPTAAPEQKTLTVQGGEEIKISVDGEAAEFDAKPFIDDNGRTQVPVRAVSELVNCKVDWNQESQTAVIEKDNGDTVKITLGSDIMLMNDNQIKMDTAAQIKDDRTYIPVRFVAEALGLTVNWIE